MTELHTHDSGTLRAGTPTPAERLVTKLGDPGAVYTAGQLAYLMGIAARWGREAAFSSGVAAGELHAREDFAEMMLDGLTRAIAVPVFSEAALRREGYRQNARREADTAAAYSWRTDHPGGPVPDWGADREAMPPGSVSVRVVTSGGAVRWRDDAS